MSSLGATCPTHGCAPALRLLGSFRLEVDRRVVDVPLGAQRLLALLGLRGRMSRPRLAGTLWPETSQAQALTNLRHVLWRLQGALGEHCVVLALGVELELADAVDCDVAGLQQGARVLWDGAPTPPPVIATQVRELLPDWDDEWVLGDRERLRQLHLHALERYAETLLAARRYGPALEAALAALHADTLRESAHRTVIRVHRAEGNVSEARRALESCRRILAADLGVTPSRETLELVP